MGMIEMRLGFTILALSLAAAHSAAGQRLHRIDIDRKYRSKTPKGIETTVFEHEMTNSSIEYVTNSGICETTPGVNQYSGYISVGANMNMWFWFFESRQDPANAPLALWLNGGPGCSSLTGLFMENGPCHFVDNQAEPTRNPHSWNNYANMLYIDQPIGTGFSYGESDVNSTVSAAPYAWKLMQVFFKNFPQYKTREFGLFTESYGGHYGPEFADYFLEQNRKISNGIIDGQKIEMIALGINNGWIDPILQNKAYVTYARNNPYRQLIGDADQAKLLGVYNENCLPGLRNCSEITGDDAACNDADFDCQLYVFNGVISSSNVDFSVYDVRIGESDAVPGEEYVDYITRKDVAKAIGARSTYSRCDDLVYSDFRSTGDNSRSFLGKLSAVVQRNITTLIWAGDADWICNWQGNAWAVNAIEWNKRKEFAAKDTQDYTVHGTVRGKFKTVDNLSWFRVYEAGHMVPLNQPEAALQAFMQTMKRQPLSPT